MSALGVYIGQPLHTAQVHTKASEAYWRAQTKHGLTFQRPAARHSLLPHVFNFLWCHAMNLRSEGVTHFAMIHGDICPCDSAGWLDGLLDELIAHDADVVSAVAPIKNNNGLTSTAVGCRDDDGHLVYRRLTVREVAKLPETFGIADVVPGDDGLAMLVNTGLWVADLRRPWAEEWTERGGFRFETWMSRDEHNRYVPRIAPEDWLLSLDMHEMGCKVLATRKVKLFHGGEADYPNHGEWGDWHTDQGATLEMAAAEAT